MRWGTAVGGDGRLGGLLFFLGGDPVVPVLPLDRSLAQDPLRVDVELAGQGGRGRVPRQAQRSAPATHVHLVAEIPEDLSVGSPLQVEHRPQGRVHLIPGLAHLAHEPALGRRPVDAAAHVPVARAGVLGLGIGSVLP